MAEKKLLTKDEKKIWDSAAKVYAEKKSRELKNNFRAVTILKIFLFGTILVTLSLIGLIMFIRPTVSIAEKRELAKFPQADVSSIWDGSFFKGIDIWYSDTYPLREIMIAASQKFQSLYGTRSEQIIERDNTKIENANKQPKKEKPVELTKAEETLPDGTIKNIGEMRGDIYIVNNQGYELYNFVEDLNLEFVQTMNNIYSRFKGLANVYVMMVPTSAGVMLDKNVLDDMGVSDQAAAIEFDYSRMDPGIHKVRVIDVLRKHNAEYVYFHTDHHWTALGAYYAYTAFCKEKGITPHDIKDYESISFLGFLGSLYTSSNRSPELIANPDNVTAYYPKSTRKMTTFDGNGQLVELDLINDVSNYPVSEYYITFVNGDMPFAYAHNQNLNDGSAAVVIKDSLGNAFIPWLVDHYEYTYWIDARYTNNTLSQMVHDYHVQDIIFEVGIYGASNPYMYGRYDKISR